METQEDGPGLVFAQPLRYLASFKVSRLSYVSSLSVKVEWKKKNTARAEFGQALEQEHWAKDWAPGET